MICRKSDESAQARERQQQRDRDTKIAYENLLYGVLEKLNAQVVAETFRANYAVRKFYRRSTCWQTGE